MKSNNFRIYRQTQNSENTDLKVFIQEEILKENLQILFDCILEVFTYILHNSALISIYILVKVL